MLQSSYTTTLVEAGLDEVGRGCLAGPVVAAAVILPNDFRHDTLDDSKKINNKVQREMLAEEIKSKAIAWAIAEVSHTKIDEINILKASFLAMHQALDQIFDQYNITPELLLVDGNRFSPYRFVPYHCIVKGDSKYYSIAAASILAKTYRDELMQDLSIQYPMYGWESNVGYPTIKHRKAIQEHGLSPWHRKSFKFKPV